MSCHVRVHVMYVVCTISKSARFLVLCIYNVGGLVYGVDEMHYVLKVQTSLDSTSSIENRDTRPRPDVI